MEIPASLTTAFPPSPDALLELTRIQIDDEMLTQIARADYGDQASELFDQLLPIRDRGDIPSPLPFWVREVLNLTKFCRPESPNEPPFEPGPTGLKGHMTRLFACAVLLVDSASGEDFHGEDSTLAQALASAKILGDEFSIATARFLSWRLSSCFDEQNIEPYWHVAMLILAVRLRASRFTDSQLTEIAQWVLDAEAKYLHDCPVNVADPRPTDFSVQSGYWAPVVAELKTAADSFSDERLRTNLQLCAMMMES